MERIGHWGRHRALAAVFVAAVSALLLSACAPSLSPLYRDYEAPASDSVAVEARVVAALQEAGWDTVATDLPHAIETEEKVLTNWGVYKLAASLEVTPMGSDHVRVFVHPYRKYFIGGKGKIQYLTRRVRARFIPELNDAFANQGLQLAGTPFERDDTVLR